MERHLCLRLADARLGSAFVCGTCVADLERALRRAGFLAAQLQVSFTRRAPLTRTVDAARVSGPCRRAAAPRATPPYRVGRMGTRPVRECARAATRG